MNVGWGPSNMGYWGRYCAYGGRMQQETAEDCIMESFITLIPHWILFGLSRQGELDGRNMWRLFSCLVWKSEGNIRLWRPRYRWEYNIKTGSKSNFFNVGRISGIWIKIDVGTVVNHSKFYLFFNICRISADHPQAFKILILKRRIYESYFFHNVLIDF
jgi:hypothetical protein